MTDKVALGRRLRNARKEQGLNQLELCEGICSNATLSRWESGQTRPTEKQIEALAKKLGIDPEVLAGYRCDPRLELAQPVLPRLLQAFTTEPALLPTTEWEPDEESPVAWIELFHAARYSADPWNNTDPGAAEELLAHPLSQLSPHTLQTATLLHAQAELAKALNKSTLAGLSEALGTTPLAPAAIRARALEVLVFSTAAVLGPASIRKLIQAHGTTPWTPALQVLAKRLGAIGPVAKILYTLRDHLFAGLLMGVSGAAAMEMALNTDVLSADWLPIFQKVPQNLQRTYLETRPNVRVPHPGARW